ncbi:MAG: pantetheine-phosphate adenylyltransferase [Akkermansia sp.]|nr:pantetheine-phosphate adenylyltransferase [Akkermansia sp.]
MRHVGIYAGSFDPPTKGHLWMMQRGAELFDELVVVLAVNPEKKGFLTMGQRAELLREMTAELPNVRVECLTEGFLVDWAKEQGATHLLRGVRNAADFDYEKAMAQMNARMAPALQSVFLMPPSELEAVSSSFVRGFVGQKGGECWVESCVPPCVAAVLNKM